jgi:hypothetical protein
VSRVRFRAWTAEKRVVIMTPDGPVIAECGDVVAVAVGPTFEHAIELMRQLDVLKEKYK